MKHLTITLLTISIIACLPAAGRQPETDTGIMKQEDDTACVQKEKAFFPVDNVDMSFQMRGSLRGDFPRGGEASARFRMDDLRWNIEGWAGKKVYYRFRQALTKGFTSLSLENLVSSVNYAFVKWHATPKTTFTFGKHVLSLGGHEFDAVPVYVIQFSDFGSSFSSYQMGASAEWHISPSHDLVFQMSNFRGVSDSEFYYGQLPSDIKETNFPLIGTVNWNGDFLDDKSLKLRYSVSYGHQTTDKGVWIVSLGHSYRKPKLGGYIDLMWSRQGLDVSGIMSRSAAYSDGTPRTLQNTEYLTAVGYLHFFFSPSIAAFVKGGWECAGIYQPYDDIVKGVHRTNWNAQCCFQYMPTRDSDFRLFAHYNYYGRNATEKGRALGMADVTEHRVSLGIIYIMKVL